MILPNEIWLHVASFIPSDDLANLYGINKLFLDLALSEKYAMVQIGNLFAQYDPHSACQYLEHMNQAHISSRIRHLVATLSFELFEQNPYQTHQFTRYHPTVILRGLTSTHQYSLRQRQDIVQNIRVAAFKFLKFLPSITHLEINYDHALYPRALSSVFVSFLWRKFGSRIDQLTIRSSLGGAAGLLSGATNIVALSEINFDFASTDFTQRVTPDHELANIDTRILARFISSTSRTLRSVSINACAYTGLQTTTLFREIGQLPDLESLALGIPLSRDGDDCELVQFVANNAAKLVNLAIPLHQSCDRTQVIAPNLRSLGIFPPVLWSTNSFPSPIQLKERRDATINTYLKSSTPRNLTGLYLGDSCLHFNELLNLLDAVPSSSTSTLQRLRLKMVAVHPQLLVGLSERFPALRDLEIIARTVQTEYSKEGCHYCSFNQRVIDNESQDPLEVFEKGISVPSVQAWRLGWITLSLEKCPIAGLEKSWERLLKGRIPSLELVRVEVTSSPSIVPLSYSYD